MSLLRTTLIQANNTRALPAARYRLQQHNSLQQTPENRVGIQSLRYVMVTKKFLLEKTEGRTNEDSIQKTESANDVISQKKKALMKPSKTVWLKGHGAIERIDKKTGEIYHLEQQAAVYQEIESEQEVSPHSDYQIVRVKKALKFNESKPEELVPHEVFNNKPKQDLERPSKVVEQKNNIVFLIQMKLKKILLYKHKVDGVFGANTKAALSMFQRKNKLPVGKLDNRTLAHLGVSA